MVFKQVKNWFIARASAARWRGIHDWADGRKAAFKIARDGSGFAVDHPKALPGPLRVEWGPSQRAYIPGNELRMRCELKLHSDLQMMVVCRELMDRLEKTVFEAYTDTLKTRVDTDTPEEMRWLVMFPKYGAFTSKIVRQRFGALGVNRDLTGAWLEGEFSDVLAQASQDLLPNDHPIVIMTMRGNLYLRTSMPEAELDKIQAFVTLLETACRQAQRVNTRIADGAGPWPTTTSVAWQSSRPEDEAAQ